MSCKNRSILRPPPRKPGFWSRFLPPSPRRAPISHSFGPNRSFFQVQPRLWPCQNRAFLVGLDSRPRSNCSPTWCSCSEPGSQRGTCTTTWPGIAFRSGPPGNGWSKPTPCGRGGWGERTDGQPEPDKRTNVLHFGREQQEWPWVLSKSRIGDGICWCGEENESQVRLQNCMAFRVRGVAEQETLRYTGSEGEMGKNAIPPFGFTSA